jgi:hypothetical protein
LSQYGGLLILSTRVLPITATLTSAMVRDTHAQPERVEPMRFRAQRSKAEGIETRRPSDAARVASCGIRLLLQL